MDFEKNIIIWKSVTWIAPILAAAIIGFAQWRISQIEKQRDAAKSQAAEQIQQAFEERLKQTITATKVDKADNPLPGIGICAVVRLEEQLDNRKKFILDTGNEEKDRISLYMDEENNLIYRVIDHKGDPHIIKVPYALHTFRYNTATYLYTEFGFSETFSFMRLFLNDVEVGRYTTESLITLQANNDPKANMKIFSDVNGKNNGKLTLSWLIVLKGTLNAKDRHELFAQTAAVMRKLNRI